MNLRSFWNDETGAITVDWVVLTASIVMLGGVVVHSVAAGSVTASDTVSAALQEDSVFVNYDVSQPQQEAQEEGGCNFACH